MRVVILLLIILSGIFSASNAANCVKPFGLFTTNITNTSVTLNWDASVTADSFMIRYNEFNSPTSFAWKTISGAGGVSTYNLTGLSPGVKYAWVVRSYCQLFPNYGYQIPADTFTTSNTPIACIRPYALGASAITNTTALISWSTLVTADTFRIRYSVNGSNIKYYRDVNAQGGGVSSVTLTNLSVGTIYQVQVSSICSGVSSGYSNSFIFTSGTTPVPCVKPFNLAAPTVTNFTALLDWTPYVTADVFRVRYSINGTQNYIYKDVSGIGGIHSATLTGLAMNTTYQYQVSSLCSGVSTGYSTSSVFSTTNNPVPCATPYGGTTSAITTTSAVLNWTPLVTADSFMIRYSATATPGNYFWKKIVGGVTSTQITGLTLNTQYQWQVRCICAGVVTSIYSPSTVFSTSPFKVRNPELNSDAIEVFPNPANEIINVQFFSESETKAILRITDMLGKVIVLKSFDIVNGDNNFEITTENLASGIYSLSVETGDFKTEKKVWVRK